MVKCDDSMLRLPFYDRWQCFSPAELFYKTIEKDSKKHYDTFNGFE